MTMKRYRPMGIWVGIGVVAMAMTGCSVRRQAAGETPEATTRLASVESRLEAVEARQRELEQKAWDVQYLKGRVEGTSPQIRQVVVTADRAKGEAASTPTVRQIQSALRQAGLYQGKVDGKIGPKTTEAVREFQRQRGLKEDGKVGPKTWAVLQPFLAEE